MAGGFLYRDDDGEISLEGKVALVTGVGPNIGSGIALALARYGAKVACNDVDEAPIKACIARIERNGGEAMAAPGDVTDEAAVLGYIAAVLERRGRIDILVDNAALLGARTYCTRPPPTSSGRCASRRWGPSSTPSMPPGRWPNAASKARWSASPRPTAGPERRGAVHVGEVNHAVRRGGGLKRRDRRWCLGEHSRRPPTATPRPCPSGASPVTSWPARRSSGTT